MLTINIDTRQKNMDFVVVSFSLIDLEVSYIFMLPTGIKNYSCRHGYIKHKFGWQWLAYITATLKKIKLLVFKIYIWVYYT